MDRAVRCRCICTILFQVGVSVFIFPYPLLNMCCLPPLSSEALTNQIENLHGEPSKLLNAWAQSLVSRGSLGGPFALPRSRSNPVILEVRRVIRA
jgi:hypothetical protein